ncbi:MAG TPA: MFS transporter, partial [Chloroflexota bacterium]|nr:MFS transporter [Chloroflexota bacterium]
GLFSAVFGLASIVGPLLGGYLTDNLSWRWVFYVNLPVGVVALTVLWLFYRDSGPRRAARSIDYGGALTLSAGVVPLLLALSWGGTQYAWGSVPIVGLFVTALVMLAAFVWTELHAAEPIMPLSLFRNRVLTVCALGIGIVGMALFGTILYIPLFVQGVIGTTATQSGTVLTPMMFAMIGSSIIGGQLIARTGKYKLLALGGLVATAAGMFLLAGMGPGTDYTTTVRNMVVIGIGLGPVMPVFTLASQSAVRVDQIGVATSLTQFARSIGGTLGTAIFGSVLVNSFAPAFQRALPAAAVTAIPSAQLEPFQNPQALLNPQTADTLQASFVALGPQGLALYATVLEAVKLALSSSLHDVFLLGAGVAAVGVLVVMFLREVPLRGSQTATRATEAGAVSSLPPVPARDEPVLIEDRRRAS